MFSTTIEPPTSIGSKLPASVATGAQPCRNRRQATTSRSTPRARRFCTNGARAVVATESRTKRTTRTSGPSDITTTGSTRCQAKSRICHGSVHVSAPGERRPLAGNHGNQTTLNASVSSVASRNSGTPAPASSSAEPMRSPRPPARMPSHAPSAVPPSTATSSDRLPSHSVTGSALPSRRHKAASSPPGPAKRSFAALPSHAR